MSGMQIVRPAGFESLPLPLRLQQVSQPCIPFSFRCFSQTHARQRVMHVFILTFCCPCFVACCAVDEQCLMSITIDAGSRETAGVAAIAATHTDVVDSAADPDRAIHGAAMKAIFDSSLFFSTFSNPFCVVVRFVVRLCHHHQSTMARQTALVMNSFSSLVHVPHAPGCSPLSLHPARNVPERSEQQVSKAGLIRPLPPLMPVQVDRPRVSWRSRPMSHCGLLWLLLLLLLLLLFLLVLLLLLLFLHQLPTPWYV
jgi:hypothetical protein